jgi:hypothetical protein
MKKRKSAAELMLPIKNSYQNEEGKRRQELIVNKPNLLTKMTKIKRN